MENYKTLNNFLGNSVPKRILIYLINNPSLDNFIFKIAKEIECTSSACSKNINLLNKLEFINLNHNKCRNIITLTEKGKEIANYLNKIRLLM
jgi:DNA-binding MarR family transcriptional regulator